MISEDYPQEFDWEYFKSLDNLKDIVKYATSKLGRPKKGSSRLTYLIDEDKVLKIAYNRVGLEQNRIESNESIQRLYDDVVTKLYEYDEEHLVWLEMENVKPFRNIKQMEKFFDGYDFYDFKNYIKDFIEDIDESAFEKLNEDEFIYQVYNLVKDYQMMLDDVTNIGSWGYSNRTNGPVLFDFGITERTFNTYYHDRKSEYFKTTKKKLSDYE
jgi:hypothetical protein